MNAQIPNTNYNLNKFETRAEYFAEVTKEAFEIAKLITCPKGELYLYGGTVRNLLLNTNTSYSDLDFIGNFDPDLIVQKYPQLVVDRWDEVSTIRLKIGNSTYDLTWTENILSRLSQNDISISNLCLTETGEIIDYFKGIDSLIAREIRIDDPESKLQSDPSRILRIFRFAVELSFEIEKNTLCAAIKYAHLLEFSDNLVDDILKILSLPVEQKEQVLSLLKRFEIDTHIDFQRYMERTPEILKITSALSQFSQIEQLAQMFNTTVYLVGGTIRDILWDKPINDFDFKVMTSIENLIAILEAYGFRKANDHNTKEGEYYISNFKGVVGIVMEGRDIHLSCVDTDIVHQLIKDGDLTFNCCVYNIHTREIENPEIIEDIKYKNLRFANASSERIDPTIIINGLKQISRIPEIKVHSDTLEIVNKSLSEIIEFFQTNTHLMYILKSLCGNLNSESVYQAFDENALWMFPYNERKKKKLKTSERYTSLELSELLPEEKNEIFNLLKRAYGKHFDGRKVFSGNVNSVVIERKGGSIKSCCLVDGERLYAAAASESTEWIALVSDIIRNNYNVWCTVDLRNKRIRQFCLVAGMHIETNLEIVQKILISKTSNYSNMLLYQQEGLPVFHKHNDSSDYPQILLRS